MNEQSCLLGHFWVYDSPNGKTSIGICKYCGATQEDFNSYPYEKYQYALNVPQIKYSPMNNVDRILLTKKG